MDSPESQAVPKRKSFLPSKAEVQQKIWRLLAAILGIALSVASLLYWGDAERERKRILLDKGALLLEDDDDVLPEQQIVVAEEPMGLPTEDSGPRADDAN